MIALNENEFTLKMKLSKGDSPLIPLSNLDKGLPSFFDLLKKAQRQLQIVTLETMEALTRRYSSQFVAHISKIQSEIAPLMTDDLQKSVIVLKIAKNLILAKPDKSLHSVAIMKAAELAKNESM